MTLKKVKFPHPFVRINTTKSAVIALDELGNVWSYDLDQGSESGYWILLNTDNRYAWESTEGM